VLSWRLSNTLENTFCIEVLEDALCFSKPEIFNTDQGSQYTSLKFLSILKDRKIRISMDSKGRALDNVFVERLWRTIKYEEVYLKDYRTMREAQSSLKAFINFYNKERLGVQGTSISLSMLREGEPYDSCGPIGSYFALRSGIWIYRIKDGCMEKGSIHACYCPHASIPTTALGLLPSIALSSELADGKYHRREFFQQKKGQQGHRPRRKKRVST
jgi:putative transposase